MQNANMRGTKVPRSVKWLAMMAMLSMSFVAGSAEAQKADAGKAESWPRPGSTVRMVVALGPGSSTDIIVRIIAEKLREATGANFIVENKTGAGGNIASIFVKNAKPDGNTILAHSVAFAVNPSLYPDAGYDAIRDFSPVALGPRTPNIITVNPATPASNLTELLDLARRVPLNYASSGIGTTTHLSIERLKTAAKVDIVHIPYQPAQAITAVVAGETQMSSTSMPPAVPQIKAGKIRAIAVTSATRSALLPDVPSVTEYGFTDFDDYTWFGFFLPAGANEKMVEQMNLEFNKAFEMPDVKARFATLGMETQPNQVAAFKSFLRSEVPKWAAVVKSSGAKAE